MYDRLSEQIAAILQKFEQLIEAVLDRLLFKLNCVEVFEPVVKPTMAIEDKKRLSKGLTWS